MDAVKYIHRAGLQGNGGYLGFDSAPCDLQQIHFIQDTTGMVRHI